MIITDAELKEFQSLYRKYFNQELNDDDASREAEELVEFLRIFLKPFTEESLYKARKEVYEYLKGKPVS